MERKFYIDNFGNAAEIEHLTNTKAYRGDTPTHNTYRIMCFAVYDNSFLYHVSCYDTLEKAENKLRRFSCGTFHEKTEKQFEEEYKKILFESYGAQPDNV